jgi:hypothetical protein
MTRYRTFLFGLVILGASLAITGRAQPTDRIPVPEVKPLLKLAIEQGSARGVIVGKTAAYIRQKFSTVAPIEVDVRTLHALPEIGCSRLEVTTRQNDVQENSLQSDKTLAYQVSYCRDGRFPDRK